MLDIPVTNTVQEPSACGDKEPFALMVIGDDMAPEFVDGMVISIDPSHPLISGCFIVAQVGDDLHFAQFKIINNKKMLVFLNKSNTILLPEFWTLKGIVVQSYKKRVTTHYQYTVADKFTKFENDRRAKKVKPAK